MANEQASGQKDISLLPLMPYKVLLAAQLLECGQIQVRDTCTGRLSLA